MKFQENGLKRSHFHHCIIKKNMVTAMNSHPEQMRTIPMEMNVETIRICPNIRFGEIEFKF